MNEFEVGQAVWVVLCRPNPLHGDVYYPEEARVVSEGRDVVCLLLDGRVEFFPAVEVYANRAAAVAHRDLMRRSR